MPSNSQFAAALNQLIEKRPVQGLFARCFAEIERDEAKTKAKYIALRAAQLEADEVAARETHPEKCRKSDEARRETRRSLVALLTLELFRQDYHGEIPLHYYGRPERQAMLEQWRKQKLASHGLEDEAP